MSPRTGPVTRAVEAADGRDAAGTLERAGLLLAAFDAQHRELTLATLVERGGLPRSTTHRLAERMVQLGWLEKPGERYRIGQRLFQLSGLVPVRHDLREALLPFMQDLYEVTRVTVQLGVLNGPEVLIVEKITGHRRLPMLSQVGGSVPAYCSGLGRAILAYSPHDVVESVLSGPRPARTPATLTSVPAILAELAAVPERGWAVDLEEGNLGITCVAVPIMDPLGEVVAALSVTGPTAAVRPEWVGPALRTAASAASRAYARRR